MRTPMETSSVTKLTYKMNTNLLIFPKKYNIYRDPRFPYFISLPSFLPGSSWFANYKLSFLLFQMYTIIGVPLEFSFSSLYM